MKFKSYVENSLGPDILDAIGLVTFDKNFLSNSMTFTQNSRTFRLKQVTGALVQLEETDALQFSYRMVGNQFNLTTNSNAKDVFLHTLGEALKQTARL